MSLTVQAESGFSYLIELVREASGEQMTAILRRDADGWRIEETTRGRAPWDLFARTLGRRKSWQRALAEALDVVEAELVRRERLLAQPIRRGACEPLTRHAFTLNVRREYSDDPGADFVLDAPEWLPAGGAAAQRLGDRWHDFGTVSRDGYFR